MYVAPEFRGLGYARMLIEALARAAREAGYVKMEWLCLEANCRALGFYERVGAKKADDWGVFKVDLQTMDGLARGEGWRWE